MFLQHCQHVETAELFILKWWLLLYEFHLKMHKKHNESNFQKLLNFLGLNKAHFDFNDHSIYSAGSPSTLISWTKNFCSLDVLQPFLETPYYRATCYHYRAFPQSTLSYYQDRQIFLNILKKKKKQNTTLHNLKPRDFIFSERPRRKISLELPRKGPSRDRGCCLVSSRDSFTVPQTVAHQVPLSLGFLSQEYGSGSPFPSLLSLFSFRTHLEPLDLGVSIIKRC